MNKFAHISEQDDPINYIPTPTAEAFHASPSIVRGLKGPIGSGKSVACVMEIFLRARTQAAWKDGVRRTRFAIMRRSYPELLMTSLKTWKEWVPTSIAPIHMSVPICSTISYVLPDKTSVESEVYFLSCDKEDDIEKLKSLELTGVWLNEVSGIEKGVLDMAIGRTGRYPSTKKGGWTWRGVIMDTNPPDEDHWYAVLAEKIKPEGWSFFNQPPGIVALTDKEGNVYYVPNTGGYGYPPAENIGGFTDGFGYYMNQVPGKSEQWIKVFLMGQYGNISSGSPVYPEYKDALHLSKEPPVVMRGMPLYLGIDLGLTPACAFGQMDNHGTVHIIDEIIGQNVGIRQFAEQYIVPRLTTKYAGMPYYAYCDPAGSQRGQNEAIAYIESLKAGGLGFVQCAPTNSFKARRESVANYMLTLNRTGTSSFKVYENCKMLVKGFQGDYKYRRTRTSFGTVDSDSPEKNDASHIHDALQYLCMAIRMYASASLTSGKRMKREVVPSPEWDAYL